MVLLNPIVSVQINPAAKFIMATERYKLLYLEPSSPVHV